ncbi:Mob1/phocein [Lactarius pseudohatsudake]|nr:Mob1/phocein [Lactarius pseudohatsudake]
MASALQRPLKGSRISTFYPIKSVPALSTLDSAFQLQEFISLTIRSDIHDVSAIISVPDSRNNAEGGPDDSSAALTEDPDGEKDSKSEFAVDEACWIYEQLRRLAQDLSHPLITMLQQECTRATCPEMKAGEWMYLCVAHGNDGAMEQCCAIDYILHTVDSATALLNSPRAFPSRISIPPPSHRHFGSLARRLGRIFAHAYFHHREVFEQAEAESSLYARFLALTCKFELVPPEFLIIPTHSTAFEDAEPPRLLAAAVDPQHPPGSDDDGDDRGRGVHRGLGVDILGGIDRNPSPRKGRTRTGTMIFSEALIMAEELGKGGGSPSPERDSIAQLAAAAAAIEAHEQQETDFVHIDVADRAEEEEEEEPLTDEHELHADLQETYDHDLDYPEEEHIATLADADVDADAHDADVDDTDTHDADVDDADAHDADVDDADTHDADVGDADVDAETGEDHDHQDHDHQGPEQDVTDDDAESVDTETHGEDVDEAPEHDVTSAHDIPSTTIIELSPADEADAPEEEEDAQEEDLTEAVVETHEDDAADAREVAEQIAPEEPQEEQADVA